MIENTANLLAIKLNNFTKNTNINVDIVRYRLAEILHISIIFAASILISLFTGKTFDVIIALIAFGILRRFSGGYHFKTLEACEVFTVSLVTIITFIHLDNTFIINTIVLVMVVIFTKKRSFTYRILSLLLVASNFIIDSDVAAISFLAQTLMLIKLRR